MSSKRNIRRRACEGKTRYASKEEAEQVPGPKSVHPYQCDFCGGWHRGHRPKTYNLKFRRQHRSI